MNTSITLHNNITHQVICEETLMKTSKNVLCELQSRGYNEDFCYEAAAIYEWFNTLIPEEYDEVKQLLIH